MDASEGQLVTVWSDIGRPGGRNAGTCNPAAGLPPFPEASLNNRAWASHCTAVSEHASFKKRSRDRLEGQPVAS